MKSAPIVVDRTLFPDGAMSGLSALAVAAVVAALTAFAGGSALWICISSTCAAVITAIAVGRKDHAATATSAAEVSRETWDYIIVGGGTAGCVLANRLTGARGKGKRVLVLEAGRSDYDATMVKIPAGVLKLFKSKYDWDFTTSNEKCTAGRGIYLPRGKVLGGSSALNVCLYNRGDDNDYNTWESKFGCVGWSAKDVLPLFKKTQDDLTGLAKEDPQHHSTGGEWATEHVRYQNPLSKRFLQACKEMGFPLVKDFNCWGRGQEGAGRFAVSERKGVRCCAASSMLKPALADQARNLKVLTGAPVERIIFADEKSKAAPEATGVLFSVAGVQHVARLAPEGEVLLTGGAIHSPQLLMISGIGPAKHLAEHGIDVVSDLAGVGENLQDHPAAVASFECPADQKGISVTSLIKIQGTNLPHPKPLLQWLFTGTGPLTSTGCDHGGFFRTAAAPKDSESPDLQMRFLAARAITADGMGTFTAFKKTTTLPDGFSFQSIAVRPLSRGRVLLKSGDPNDKPIIEGNYLSDKADVSTIREGLKLARMMAKQPAFKGVVGSEIFPGPHVQTDAQLDAYIADTVHTGNALVGTCRMGPANDPFAVCDPEMRVKGVHRLRVCDASIMPKMPGAQTGACVVMQAERAADLLLADMEESHPNWAKLNDLLNKKSGAEKAKGSAAKHSQEARDEIACKLIKNHKKVITDITNDSKTESIQGSALTQKDLKRMPPESKPYVDQMMREVARRLLGERSGVEQLKEKLDTKQKKIYRGCATYLAVRIQSKPEQKPGRKPDMSEAAAAAFVAVLEEVASDCEKA